LENEKAEDVDLSEARNRTRIHRLVNPCGERGKEYWFLHEREFPGVTSLSNSSQTTGKFNFN